jgi:hypothetical protein
MKSTLFALKISAALAGLLMTACSTVQLQSLGSPNANFGRMRTFSMLEPQYRHSYKYKETDNVENPGNGTDKDYDHAPAWETKPMLNNTIVFDAGREFVRQALIARGFVETNKNPDFTVAFYAAAQERLYISDWGYPYNWGYGYGCCFDNGFGPYITQYTQGTVIIDLVNPDTKKLLWRGRAVADVSNNPQKYVGQLANLVPKIVNQVPSGGALVALKH